MGAYGWHNGFSPPAGLQGTTGWVGSLARGTSAAVPTVDAVAAPVVSPMSVPGTVTYAAGMSGLPVPPPEVLAAAAGWPLGFSEQARGTAPTAITGVAGPIVVPQQPQGFVSQQSDQSEVISVPGSSKEAVAPVAKAAEEDSEENDSEKDRDKDMKLPPYDGLTSLETFLAKFEHISRYRKWNDTDRFYQLCNALDDPAGQILWGLAASATADSVIALLRTRFGNDLRIERFRAELRARRRKPGESLQFLYNDITRMVSLAHPTSVKDLTDRVAKEAFIGAIDDEWLKMRVMDKQPDNIEQALGIAGSL